MKKRLGVLGISIILLAMPLQAAQPSAAGPVADPMFDEARVAAEAEVAQARILSKWAPFVAELGTDITAWHKEMAINFAAASPEGLARAAGMETYQGMMSALAGKAGTDADIVDRLARLSERTGMSAKDIAALGDAASDLVYIPLANACRIADTQVAGGVIAAGATRNLDVTAVSDYTFQGGEASNCSGMGAAGSFAAVLLSVRAPAPASDGFLTLFPFLATQPANRSLDYSGGESTSGTVLVRLDQGASASELSVFSSAQTHLVLDAVGYFINPQATALECVEKLSSGNTISAGSFGTQSTASCDAGYTITGGGCSMSNFDGRVVTTRTIVSGSSQTHFCAFRNEGASTVDGLAYARCCRIPGRP